jgi:hypothetical protein
MVALTAAAILAERVCGGTPMICEANGDARLFDDPAIAALWLRHDLIAEGPVAVLHNGVTVDCANTPGPDLFDAAEIYYLVPGTGSFPQVVADLFVIDFSRLTYLKIDGTSASFGTSIVATVSFRVPGGLPEHFRFLPEITLVTIEDDVSPQQRFRITSIGSFGEDATMTSTRTYPDPALGLTTAGVNLRFTALREIALDPDAHRNDAFRLVTGEAMFADSNQFDVSAIRWQGPDGAVRTLHLTDDTPAGHLLPAPAEIGRWFELVKEPGSSWYPDSPTIRVEIDDCGEFTPRLGIQGFLSGSNNPNDDSLTVWLEWIDAPNPIPAGTVVDLDLKVTAKPPAPVCEADLDGDGNVGVGDFLILLAGWGPNPGHPADLDGDGAVGVSDFLALLAGWGPCT